MNTWPQKISVQLSIPKFDPSTQRFSILTYSIAKMRHHNSNVSGLVEEATKEIVEMVKKDYDT